MAHRAYPSRQRALRQLDRHCQPPAPALTPLQASAREALIVIGELAAPIVQSLNVLRSPSLEGWRRG